MKNIIPALFLTSLFTLSIFSQTTQVGRPRVVVTPTATPMQTATPIIPAAPVGPPPSLVIESDEEVRVDTNLVTLPVSVLDREGRFIGGLDETDFVIFENGEEQQVE